MPFFAYCLRFYVVALILGFKLGYWWNGIPYIKSQSWFQNLNLASYGWIKSNFSSPHKIIM